MQRLTFFKGIDRRSDYFDSNLFDMTDCTLRGNSVIANQDVVASGEGFTVPPFVRNGSAIVTPSTVGQSAAKTEKGVYLSLYKNDATYDTKFYPYDSGTAVSTEPTISNVAETSVVVNTTTIDGFQQGRSKYNPFVSYILIPYDENGQPGKWYYFHHKIGLTHNYATVTFTVTINSVTRRFDVYRTREYGGVSTVQPSPSQYVIADVADFSYYKLATESCDGSDDTTVQFEDFQNWEASDVSSDEYEPLPNVMEIPAPYTYRIGARTIKNDGGRMLYGGARIQLRTPQLHTKEISYTSGATTTTSNITVRFVHGYKTRDGMMFSLHNELVGNIFRAAYLGADELRIYVKGADLEFRHYKTLINPDARGFYVDGDTGRHTATITSATWDEDATRPIQDVGLSGSGGGIESSGIYADYPGNIFMSELFQPKYISSSPVELVDSEIRLLTTARPHEDDIRSFNFYILTEKSVMFAQREETTISTEPVTSVFGIKVQDSLPVYTKTDAGLVIVGTNERLTLLNGREYAYIDEAVVGQAVSSPLWSTITSVAYGSDNRLLYVQTDNGIYLYDMTTNVWSGNYDLDAGEVVDEVEHGDETKVYYLTAGSLEEFISNLQPGLPNDATGYLFPSITTLNVLPTEQKINVDKYAVDFLEGATDASLKGYTYEGIFTNSNLVLSFDHTIQNRRFFYPIHKAKTLVLKAEDFLILHFISLYSSQTEV